MMRFFLGLWLLSASWMFGLDYFATSSPALAGVLMAAGTLLLCFSQFGKPVVVTSRQQAIVLLALLLPAVFLMPWPGRLAPVLLLCGLALAATGRSNRASRAVASGLCLSGTILLAQALALAAYTHGTARSHELPWPIPQLLAAFVRVLGVDAGADGSDLAFSTMRHNHRLGATWELFCDPATVCFLVGGLIALALGALAGSDSAATATLAAKAPTAPASKSKRKEPPPSAKLRAFVPPPALQAAGLLLLAGLLWLPARVGLHVGAFLHRALRTEYEAPLNLMDQFWSPWPQFLLLLPLAMLAAYWLRHLSVPGFSLGPSLTTPRPVLVRAAGFACAAAAAITLAVHWDPVGTRKAGRIAVDEFHSKWEPTGRPMDTEWYGHLSGYNYACLYDYCTRFYEMSRLTNTLTDAALAGLDVLILKVPTERIPPAEIDVIVRYVERGGSALLIGEHTDVFNTGYNLNSVSRRFGFEFRYDCLFGMESFFDQSYTVPFLRHPVLQNLRAFDFATSCSIDPLGSSGRGVIVATGLKNSMADYHANNYYPQAVDHAAMRSGAFVQLWAARHGRGRVLAFSDSTIFSNFSAFEPGKSELFLGMLEWLNRRDGVGNPRPLLRLLGIGLLALALSGAVRHPSTRGLLLAAAVFGWGVASFGLAASQRAALPVPAALRPLTWVTVDRAVCDGPLSKGGFIGGKADGFGIFERWILRLGYFIQRRAGPDAAHGELTVFFYPTKPVSPEYRQSLQRYVEAGGRLLILDSPANTNSTAGALLEPFGLAQRPLTNSTATLTNRFGWPAVPVEAAHEITGGRPLFHWHDKAVGAVANHGQGSVIALGFGSRFSDTSMGATGDVVPDAELRKVFDLQFDLLRAIVGGKLDAKNAAR